MFYSSGPTKLPSRPCPVLFVPANTGAKGPPRVAVLPPSSRPEVEVTEKTLNQKRRSGFCNRGAGQRVRGSWLAAMKTKTSLGLFSVLITLVVLVTVKIQFEHLKMEGRYHPFMSTQGPLRLSRGRTLDLPRGIMDSTSDMELKPLWQRQRQTVKSSSGNVTALLAIVVGIKQKTNVDLIVRKFLLENCSVILFHYDGNVDGWHDLEWSNEVVHILAPNQTKWWFAKRFLHPDVVSVYDYIFLWDEDLGIENFHPGRYLKIMISEGLEISQPALDPESPEIHHRITIRNKTAKVHRRIYAFRGSVNCSDESRGPPCTGWVEGMAPVFSRTAWHCVWHLIQNDLIHGWGLDMKLGYCAQGDRTQKVGVIDSEFIIHQGIPSLGGSSKTHSDRSINLRSHIRRQSTAELEKFQQRWDQAAKEDKDWVDPFDQLTRKRETI